MWKAGAEQIPKLTVRVRFPSPAPSGERPGRKRFPKSGPPGTRRATHPRGTQISAVRMACKPGAMRDRRSRCRCPAWGAAAMVPRRHGAIGCATNDPETTPRSWRACERWRKPVRQPPVMRTAAAVPGPLILAKEGQSPSPARAELAFHRTRDATCRCSTRWPRGGLSRAGPSTPRRTAMPPAGLAEWQGNGADDEQPSR
jgi:hypothetical protein